MKFEIIDEEALSPLKATWWGEVPTFPVEVAIKGSWEAKNAADFVKMDTNTCSLASVAEGG
eukprot:9351152-Karenia_brevis.AAC.1